MVCFGGTLSWSETAQEVGGLRAFGLAGGEGKGGRKVEKTESRYSAEGSKKKEQKISFLSW